MGKSLHASLARAFLEYQYQSSGDRAQRLLAESNELAQEFLAQILLADDESVLGLLEVAIGMADEPFIIASLGDGPLETVMRIRPALWGRIAELCRDNESWRVAAKSVAVDPTVQKSMPFELQRYLNR
jgi:hypothetical protein